MVQHGGESLSTGRRRVALGLAGVALVLVGWTAYLSATLPERHTTTHWTLAWVGFDVALAAAAAATAVAVARCSPWLVIAATIAGTLLCCDAWFDVLTAAGASESREAIAQAVLVELPLAAFCFWLAGDSERTLVRALQGVGPRRETAGEAERTPSLRP